MLEGTTVQQPGLWGGGVSGAGSKITCGRLDTLTGSLGGAGILAHCFLALQGPLNISVASPLGEEEPGKLILAEVLQR